MKYRNDKYGNKLSVLGFGCMRFPSTLGKSNMKETEKLILTAVEKGINYFDTAYIYGDSEKVLGEILNKNNLREKIYIATKLPFTFRTKKEDFDKCLNMQLERLKTNYIDYYLIHMLTDYDMWLRLVDLGIEDWIKEKKKEGKIKQIGFSYHGSQYDFIKILDAYDWEFCQIQYNYMNENYQAGKIGLHKAHEKGLPVVIMEPLLGGKLATKLPKKAIAEFQRANDKISPVAWALKWLWNQKEVTLLLSGMNHMDQLIENTHLASESEINMLSEDELGTVNNVVKIFNEAYKIPCTECNYCMPCPHNVNIPAAFNSYNTCFAMGRIEGIKQYIMSVGIISDKDTRLINCKKCGLCEKKCPQNIEIIKKLSLSGKRLEHFIVRFIFWVTKTFVKKKKE